MKRYRLALTLFFSFLLHTVLLYLLIQKPQLGFKKGIGEHRIKASFKQITDFDTQLSAPLPKSSPPKKKTKPKKQIEQIKKEAPKTTQEALQKESPQESKEGEKNIEEQQHEVQEVLQEEAQEIQADLQELQSPQDENTQEQPIPDFQQSLAYQFADATTKKNISEFYGPEFGYLGKEEQEYIINNLAYIGRITQKYLRYPANAAMLQQGGGNVVEFYLHPNGDISDLKIIKKSGFILLDRNSIKTIEIAYKDYPHPKTKTLIRFYINYYLRYR